MPKERRYKKASSRIAKRRKIKSALNLSLKIGLPVVVMIGLIFLSRADFMQVKSFEVAGADTMPQQSIKNTASGFASGTIFFVIPKSNIFFMNKEKLAAALLSSYPRIEKVDVSKQFLSGSVDLSLTERKPDFLWCSGTGVCYFMDKTGLVFEKSDVIIPDPALQGKVIFSGVLGGNPLMKSFATPEEMQNYLKLVDTLNNAGFKVSSINIESSDKGTAKTDAGDVIFNPAEADLSVIAQNVILLINDIKGKTPSAQFQYIDARFGNKVFYKLI